MTNHFYIKLTHERTLSDLLFHPPCDHPSEHDVQIIADKISPPLTRRLASESRHAALTKSHRELEKIVAAFDKMREEEQRRLAHDMHDDLGQLLSAMKIDLAVLRARIPGNRPELEQPINNINELVDAMVVSVRRIIADLPPKILEDFGLLSALALLTSSFQKRHRIVTRFIQPAIEPTIPQRLKTPIYRMAQEALNNVAKHAHASQVDVSVDCREEHIHLAIRDNGTGISPLSLKKIDSFGLIGMRQRATALGGQLTIHHIKGAGTEIRIRLPLHDEALTPSTAR